MADDRFGGYGRREGWRERDSSIFSDDDDRWERGSGRWSSGRGDDDRGFFERAGDEVRSWFGDEEAERRRERDVRRVEMPGAFVGRDQDRRSEVGRPGTSGTSAGYGFSSQFTGESDWEHGGRERAGWGSGFGGSTSFGGGRSQWDDNYRRWRDQQIRQLDREYDEFCRERQQQFEQDFDSWRTSRLTEGGPSGGEAAPTGGTASFTGRGATGQAGAGPAIGSSAGAASEAAGKVGAGESEGGGRGRGARSRS